MAEQLRITTDGDLEAVILAESYDLLGSLIGPNMYRVSGGSGEQQAMFDSREIQALFYIRLHEFLATTGEASGIASIPGGLSLFSGGGWLCSQYPDEAKAAGLDLAYERARAWFDHEHRIVCWSGSIERHLELKLSMRTAIAVRSNLEKHQLFKLGREIERLRSKCAESECVISIAEAIGAREEFDDHVRGMLEYHATEAAEVIGKYFLAIFRFVRHRYSAQPTNDLRVISPPENITDDVFRYMYAATVSGLTRWTESRIVESTPETARCFKGPYPQHTAR